MKKSMSKVYIVVGVRENVYQDRIGGDFSAHPSKEIVQVFCKEQDAKDFIESNRLAKPKRVSYGDTSYYKTGHLELEIEEHYIK